MKSINLFGQEEHVFTNRRKSQKSIFDDYEGFVEKFNPKKTTDDCYTPPAVYDYVLQYVADHCDIDGMTVVRPFYPGGDYESLVYPDNCVVIDNPPFSIVSQIVRFYLKRGIKFFLFAPHLTLFSADLDCTRIVCGAAIVYENGAKVNTSFLSNMFGEAGVIGDPVLYEGIDAICSAPKAELPKYKYPDCVLTVSDVAYIVKNKGEIKIDKREMVHHSALDIQKKHGKSIYGSGFLISYTAAERVTDGWILTDDNLLACSPGHIDEVFAMLARQPHKPQFTGGLEAALLTPTMAQRIHELHPQSLFFAYDTPNDLDPLVEAGKMLIEAGFTKSSNSMRCYVLCGYKGDTFEKAQTRMGEAWRAGFMPMAMLFRDLEGKYSTDWRRFQRQWANPTITICNCIKHFGR